MHEHKLAREILPSLEKLARDNGLKKVTRIVLDVGMLHCVEADFLAHSFEHAFEGTIFEGAQTDINIVEPGETLTNPDGGTTIATGREIIIKKIEGED